MRLVVKPPYDASPNALAVVGCNILG